MKESLDQIATNAATQATQRVRVALPATIIAYDHPRATVRVDVRTPFFDLSDDEDADDPPIAYETEPPIYDVPVAFYAGGGVAVRFRPLPGDTGVLLVCHRSIDEWLNGNSLPTQPARLTRFDLSDAVFLPGLRSFADPLDEAPENALVFDGDEFRLGGNAASEFLARADRVEARLAAIEDAFNAHVHTATGPTAPTTTPVAVPGLIPILGTPPVASDTVKAR